MGNLESENKQIKKDYELLDDLKKDCCEKLGHQNDYVINMEEKIYKSNKISLELLKQLKDAEVEIDCLK